MKINVEFTVKIENKGEQNQTNINVDLDSKFLDVATALKLVEKNLQETIMEYIGKIVEENGRPLTEKQSEKILQNVTFREIYEK